MNRFQPHHHMYYIQSFNPSIMHRTNNHDMMLQFYHILILMMNHFLPQLLRKTCAPHAQELFLQITSFFLSISSTQLFVSPEMDELSIDRQSTDSHVLFIKLLSLNTDDVSVLCRIFIGIISCQPNTSAYTPLDADTRSSFISQESIGSIGNLWFTEHEDVMEMKETET
eukprot:789085_1